MDARTYEGTGIPPEIYDIGFGWDPAAEIAHLQFVCRDAELEPRSALELGCGTGRLLRAFEAMIPELAGIERSAAMAAYAQTKTRARIVCGDMSRFAFERTFDLIYSSAETIRWVTDDAAIDAMWWCVAAHLSHDGVFVADLTLGIADEAARLNQPACWSVSRGRVEVRVQWAVIGAPTCTTPYAQIEWRFARCDDSETRCWRERCELRAYDAVEFVRCATNAGLRLRSLYEVRDPYLLERSVDRANGRVLAVFERPTGSSTVVGIKACNQGAGT